MKDKNIRIIEQLECKRCGNIWWPTKPRDEVKTCSRCRSPLWNVEKTDKKGFHNGNETSVWVERLKQVKKKE